MTPRWTVLSVSLFAVSFSAGARAEEDAWLGADKALHFGVSAALAGAGYATSSLVLEPHWERAAAGAGFSLALGGAKELYDLTGDGDPSWKDFTWDVAGTAFGIGLSLLVDAALSSGSRHPGGTSGSRMAIRF